MSAPPELPPANAWAPTSAPTPVPAGLGATAVRGVIWGAGVTLANRGVSILAQLVIAAILLKSDFGTFAKALFFSGLISQAVAPAVDQFLVSRAKEYARFAGPAFWLAAASGLASVALHAALAPVAAHVQRNEALLYVLPLMGVGNMLGTCVAAATARLSIELRFREVAALSLVTGLGIQSLSVIGALAGLGVLALVLPAAIVNAGVLAFYLARGLVPGLWRRPFGLWREILGSSTKLMGVRVLQSAVAQGDYFILGLFASDATVGVYYFAFNLAEQVGRLLGASVSSVLTPSLAQLSGDTTRARSAVLNASRLLSVGVMPLCFCQILFAFAAVFVLFGDKWLAAVPLIQIMTIGAMVNVPAWPTGSMLTAAGRFGDLLKLWLLNVPMFAALITTGTVAGRHFGDSEHAAAVGTAVGLAAFYVLATVVGVRLSMRNTADTVAILRTPVRPMLIGAVACLPAVVTLWAIGTSSRPAAAVALAVGGATFLATYAFALRLVAPELWAEVRARILSRRKQHQPVA